MLRGPVFWTVRKLYPTPLSRSLHLEPNATAPNIFVHSLLYRSRENSLPKTHNHHLLLNMGCSKNSDPRPREPIRLCTDNEHRAALARSHRTPPHNSTQPARTRIPSPGAPSPPRASAHEAPAPPDAPAARGRCRYVASRRRAYDGHVSVVSTYHFPEFHTAATFAPYVSFLPVGRNQS